MIAKHECKQCGETVTLPDTHWLHEVKAKIDAHYEVCEGQND